MFKSSRCEGKEQGFRCYHWNGFIRFNSSSLDRIWENVPHADRDRSLVMTFPDVIDLHPTACKFTS
jgi:hypothetical protein